MPDCALCNRPIKIDQNPRKVATLSGLAVPTANRCAVCGSCTTCCRCPDDVHEPYSAQAMGLIDNTHKAFDFDYATKVALQRILGNA